MRSTLSAMGIDRRKLRIPDYDERVTVRVSYEDRVRLRRIAEQLGTTESDLVREGISVTIAALAGDN
jgi:hypothetical protein